MTGWFVELVGDRNAFAVLAGLPVSPSVQVAAENGDLLFGGTEIDQATSAVNAHALAERLLDLLNGLGVLIDSKYRRLCVGSQVFRRNPDGTRSWAAACFGAHVYSIGSSSSWSHRTPPPLTHGSIAACRTSPPLQRCLRLLGHSGSDWRVLANIFEIVCAGIGGGSKGRGEERIAARGWLTKQEMKLFRWTADHPDASGDASRHGHATTVPPEEPMLLPEAQTMIRFLLALWIHAKGIEIVAVTRLLDQGSAGGRGT